MSRQTRAYWFVPFRIRDPDVLERWFEDRAKEGWVADRLGFLSALRMTLVHRDDPPTYRYVIDPRRFPNVREDDLISSAGWEDVGTLSGRDVWRIAYEGERPDFLGG